MAAVASVEAPFGISLSCSLKMNNANKVILEISFIQLSSGSWTNVGYSLRVLFINSN